MSSTPVSHRGWVPIRLALGSGEPSVDWCWLGETPLKESFFDDDIDLAMRRPFNTLFTHRTPIAALEEHVADSPGIAPAGFIFHMSRCGSTLLSRMLAGLPGNVVLSEASPVDRIARAAWIPEPARAQWLRWIVSALARKSTGAGTRCFVKFDSITVAALPFIRSVFPDVPWIFLSRNPEEVLVSQVRDPAPAMSPGIVTDFRLIDVPAEEALSMSVEGYAARVVGRLCECAIAGIDDRGLLADYTELPEAAWARIARHFELDLSGDEIVAMQRLAPFNAKHPRSRFASDSAGKQNEASEAIREAAERWIWPHYRELTRLRSTQAAYIP